MKTDSVNCSSCKGLGVRYRWDIQRKDTCLYCNGSGKNKN